jgi:hypothetical protein
MDRLLWQHLCPQWSSCSRARSIPCLLTGSVEGPILCWLPPCCFFLELKSELELLGSGRNMDMIEDEEDALWTQVHAASDSLALYVPSSVARDPPHGVGE